MAWWMKDVVQIRALDSASIRSDFSPTKKVLPWPSVLVSGGNALGRGATTYAALHQSDYGHDSSMLHEI
jgi:hypothetical protein